MLLTCPYEVCQETLPVHFILIHAQLDPRDVQDTRRYALHSGCQQPPQDSFQPGLAIEFECRVFCSPVRVEYVVSKRIGLGLHTRHR